MDFATDFDTLRMLNSQGYYFYNNNNNNNNNMEPLSALAIGSSIIGGIGNLFGQNEANRTQMAIAQKQMDWQTQENQKNRDYQTEMWNRQNEYNTPANQRKLLQDAGYNPFVLQQNGSTSGAGSVGTPSMVGAPNMPHIQPVNPLQGVSSFMDALTLSQQQQTVDSNVEKQRSDILRNYSEMLINSYKEAGPDGFKQMWNKLEPSFSTLDFFNSPAYKTTMEQLDKLRIENDANSLKKSLLQKYGDKDYQKKFEQIDQLISESASKIQLMATQGHVNEGTVWKMGYEVGKLLAESNLLGQQANQISTLLPYMVSKMEGEIALLGHQGSIANLQSGLLGMEFLDNEALFASNEKVRSMLHSNVSKYYQQWNKAMSSDFNPVLSFIKGVGSSIGSVLGSSKLSPMIPRRNYNYFFNVE